MQFNENIPILPRNICNVIQADSIHHLLPRNNDKHFMFIANYISNKNFKRLNWILLICIILVVAYMFKIKGNVQDLAFEIKQISSQIEQEKKQYSVLKAELAYLRSPQRLQKLALQYLDLESIKPEQFVVDEPRGGKLNSFKFAALSNKSKTKWRYKKAHNNIYTVSMK